MAVAPLINSAILAAGAVTIALPLGTLLAVVLTKFSFPGRRAAIASLGVLLFLPLYIQLSAWDAAFGKLGWYSLTHGSLAEPLLAGMRGAIFVHGIAAVPWVALVIGIGLLQVDPAQEEAALLVFPPAGVLWRITLRQSLPFVLAAGIWIVVSTTSEMTVTNIYLVDPRQWTFTERFYMRLAGSDAGQAAIGVLPGVCALGFVIAAALWMIRRLASRRVLATIPRPIMCSAGRWQIPLTAVVWMIIAILLCVPLASLVIKAGFVVIQQGGQRLPSWSALSCLREVAAVPRRFAIEIRDTAEVACGAAMLALVAASFLAWHARRGGGWSIVAILFIVLGLAIPGPLVGAGLIRLLNHDLPPMLPLGDSRKSWLLLLYDDSPLAAILAQAIRAVPLATLLLWHSFATLSDDVLDAAALDGLSPRQVFWRIAAAQRWRSILAAWIAAFAISAGDLAWVHLVTPPGLDLLQRRVFGLVHSGVEEQVAAISLCTVILYAALAIVTMRLFFRQKRNTNRH
jgi:iron(III) transport system permease protein